VEATVTELVGATGQAQVPDTDPDRARPTSIEILGALLHAAARVSAMQTRALRPVGLSPSAFAVLGELDDAQGAALEPCTLADRLGVTRPSMCGLVDGLEGKALVQRAPHEHDGRRVLVHLTPEGRRVAQSQTHRYEAALGSALEGLSGAERRELLRLLRRVAVPDGPPLRRSGACPD
jgi:DNA-binding MarR family transcriptional regulator